MPWYLEEELSAGAFAAFLGVTFTGRSRWHSGAIGDCCLFLVRGDRLYRAFPIRRSRDFGNHPRLLCSCRQGRTAKVKRSRVTGDWRSGDVMLLATDALAQWFLRNVEDGGEPWKELLGVECQEQFESLIQQTRDQNAIRNDDVTMVVVQSQVGVN
jgi:hypothetical protein